MSTAIDDLVCPACGSDHINPARARGLDHLVMLIGSRPYQCADCGERFRSTASPAAETGSGFVPSVAAQAVCPNCHHETTIRLTQGEQQMADDEGWVVSCPGCRALYPFIKPGDASLTDS